MRLRYTRRAKDNLSDIRDYIAQDNPAAARHVVTAIRDQTRILTHQPNIGRPGRVEGTRELAISRYPLHRGLPGHARQCGLAERLSRRPDMARDLRRLTGSFTVALSKPSREHRGDARGRPRHEYRDRPTRRTGEAGVGRNNRGALRR